MPTFLPNLNPRRTAALLALCGTCLGAADFEWPKPELKIRTGIGGGSKDDLRGQTLGFGFCLTKAFPWGEASAELGYNYKTGDRYFGTIQPAASGMAPVDGRNSAEFKANDLQGFAVRLAVAWPLPFQDWSWHAGLMLGGAKFRQEATGDLRSTPWGPTAANLSTTWRDTYTTTPESGGLPTSPLVGATWRVNRNSSLEINLLVLNYRAVDYVHRPGSGTYTMAQNAQGANIGMLAPHNAFPADSVAKTTRWWPHLELGWTWRF